MEEIFQEILPLIFIILIGVLVKRFTTINMAPLTGILIFVATPAVVFFGAYELELLPGLILLPFYIFGIGTAFALFCERYTKLWWSDGTHRLLAISVGTSNTGYFGLPMTIALLGTEALPAAVMFAFGQMLFVNTVGYYLAARYQYSSKEAKKQFITLPVIYALLLGLILNYFSVDLHFIFDKSINYLSDLYIPLGMLVIGIMLTSVTKIKLDVKYLIAIIINKFFIWPLATILCILLDQYFFLLLTNDVYSVMLLQSFAPSGANMAALSAQFNIHPDKAALAILVTTIIAIFCMPLAGGYLVSFLGLR